MKFRKKPVVIEAVQLTKEKGSVDEVLAFVGKSGKYARDEKGDPCLIIHTLEGDHKACLGDYVIKGVHGEFYPCKPDIFAKTYELAETKGVPYIEVCGEVLEIENDPKVKNLNLEVAVMNKGVRMPVIVFQDWTEENVSNDLFILHFHEALELKRAIDSSLMMGQFFEREYVEELMADKRVCRVCGCTDYDCSDCVEKTGSPCHWVAVDLCSACEDDMPEEEDDDDDGDGELGEIPVDWDKESDPDEEAMMEK